MDPITTTIVLTMALPGVIGKCIDVSTNFGMEKWKSFSALESAISSFSKRLPSHVSESATALRTWIKSDTFATKARQAGTNWPLNDAITSFCEATGLSDSPVPGMTIEELIGEFLIELSIHFQVLDPKLRIKTERKQFVQLMTAVSSIHSDITKLQKQTEQICAHLEETKSPTIFSYEMHDSEDRLPEEADFHSRIDTAVAHLKRGKVQQATEDLIQIRQDVGARSTASSYLTYRVAGNLGDCYSRLEQLAEAKSEYQRALNAKATRLNYSNLSAAMLNLDENAEALELSRKAMGFEKTNGRTVAIHMHALNQNGLVDELAQLKNRHQQLCDADPDCLLALGQIKYDERVA